MLFIYSILTGPMERKLVLKLCLERKTWKLLEMYILLTDDIVKFDMRYVDWRRDMLGQLNMRAADIKLPHKQHLIFPLLIARCPVSEK